MNILAREKHGAKSFFINDKRPQIDYKYLAFVNRFK